MEKEIKVLIADSDAIWAERLKECIMNEFIYNVCDVVDNGYKGILSYTDI